MKKVVLLNLFVTIVFVLAIVLTIKDSSNLRNTANIYAACDIVSTIDHPGGITIQGPQDTELTIPNGTEIRVSGIHLNGSVEVDSVDVEISEEMIEAYRDDPIFTLTEISQSKISYLIFGGQIKVSDVDSEELAQLYDKLCEKHNNFDIYVAVSVILASLVYFCPVVIVTVRAVKRSEYGSVALIVPLLSLVISLLVLRYTFLAFVG